MFPGMFLSADLFSANKWYLESIEPKFFLLKTSLNWLENEWEYYFFSSHLFKNGEGNQYQKIYIMGGQNQDPLTRIKAVQNQIPDLLHMIS